MSREGINLFKTTTGMLINLHKSTMSPYLLREPEVRTLTNFFPAPVSDLQKGIKYLDFHLKPNNSRKSDWKWLIEKLEKRLQSWSNKWLSRVGRLMLVKSILEAILVYWMSIAWIPKGVLEKLRQICFTFL
jgi:hypothetical protein